MSKFIKLTKLDDGSILVPVEQIVWVVDNIEQKIYFHPTVMWRYIGKYQRKS